MYPCRLKVLDSTILKTNKANMLHPGFDTTGLKCNISRCGTYIAHPTGEVVPEAELKEALLDMCACCCKYPNDAEGDMHIRTGWVVVPDLDKATDELLKGEIQCQNTMTSISNTQNI